jgi:hypothetical protein
VSLAQGDDEGTWPRSVCGSASIKKKIFWNSRISLVIS